MIENRKEITTEAINTFMEGHDPMKGIVNVSYSYREDKIRVYYRNEKDQKCVHIDSFYPFLWAKRSVCVRMCDGNRNALKNLMNQSGIAVKALSTINNEGESQKIMEEGYCFLFYATRPMSQQSFNSFFKKTGCPIDGGKKDKGDNRASSEYLKVSPVEQYLIKTGRRFFKGFDDYDQILRLIFDLETEGLDPKRHRITQVGMRFNRPFNGRPEGFEKIFSVEGNTKEELDRSELTAIDTMLRVIYTFKPDVITAHNGENFDWNFIIERCNQLGTSIEAVSSKYFNGESIRKENFESSLKLGGEVEKFKRTIVPNIIITDSLHAVRRAQATDSNFLRADLKYSTDYLGMKKPNRVYTPGKEIANIWKDMEVHYAFNDKNGDWYLYDPNCDNGKNHDFKPGKDGDKAFVMYTRNYIADDYTLVSGRYIIERYLLDDLWECDKVEAALNGTDFMMTKILPLSYQKAVTMGTAGQWKALMMAWSYENNLAIPKSENTGSFTGGLSRLLVTGYIDKIAKFDYNSLYPSILLTWGISDKNDLMGTMLKFLEYVLTTREKHKKLKKNANKLVDAFEERMNNGETLTPEEMDEYKKACNVFNVEDNRQMVWKKLGNSFFGSYGSNNGAVFPWKSLTCAERTTCTGRQSLRLMIKKFHDLGYKPLVGDTDGFNFQLPDDSLYRYTKEHPYVSPGLSRETKKDVEYTGFKADVAEFNDLYMSDKHYASNAVNKMGLGIDEILDASINFSRKNYADWFPEKPFPKDVKLVGNTVKSKKMPEYIAKFLSKGVRLLLNNKGKEFLDEYYKYVNKIYNYQIPLKDIASKGKIKKTIPDYIEDCKTLTAAGRPKSRQAWMELAIRDGLNVDLGDTLYYINTGNGKSQPDAKKVTRYIMSDGMFNEKTDITSRIDREYKKAKSAGYAKSKDDFITETYPKAVKEEEIILNSELLPREIVESEEDYFCEEDKLYNVPMYLDKFNKRITPLLVCFSKDIRSKILIMDPDDRPYFSDEECKLVNGQPNKQGDQDTYEQLMTMEDKEIKFWMAHPEFKIPFIDECEMDWEKIKNNYLTRMAEEKAKGIDIIKNEFFKAIAEMNDKEYHDFMEEGAIPASINKIVDYDPESNAFKSPKFPDTIIGTIYDIIDRNEVEDNDDFTAEYSEES